jgi:predicted nucleic-acid-binding protein
MISLDTNVFVRLFITGNTPDDARQSILARNLVVNKVNKDIQIFISNIVLTETYWIFKKVYKISDSEIVKIYKKLTKTDYFTFENLSLLNKVILDLEKNKLDFADCLIKNISKINKCKEIYSFDKKAIKLLGFKKP